MRLAKKHPSKRAKKTNASGVEMVEIDYGRLQLISKFVSLSNVELGSVSFESKVPPKLLRNEELGQSEFALGIEDACWFRKDSLFEIALSYGLAGSYHFDDVDRESLSLFYLRTCWVASYELPADFERPSSHEEVAADFVFANGQVNIFPYLRQLVVDITAKAGWPPLCLPVFRVPKSRPRLLARNSPVWNV